jgi:DMSO/TMAO reductase YedYZ molybdopterin-dependent catalytic subunit
MATRGFFGRDRGERDPRLPPGQYDTGSSWPVLTAEVTPRLSTDDYTFRIDGLVDNPTTWTWDELHALPESTYQGDIHCVTTWSKFDMTWKGVSLDDLFAIAGPQLSAAFAIVTCHTAYTTNLPLEDLRGGKAWIAWEADGQPLSPDHGGPVRLLVPHLYFWKSAKFVAGIRLAEHDEPGFWEVNGYHDRGDPWLEQRYQGD